MFGDTCPRASAILSRSAIATGRAVTSSGESVCNQLEKRRELRGEPNVDGGVYLVDGPRLPSVCIGSGNIVGGEEKEEETKGGYHGGGRRRGESVRPDRKP